MNQGKLGEALVMFSKLAQSHPQELNYSLHISGILHFLNKKDEARKVLINGVSRRAYTVAQLKGRPELSLLRLRGMKNAYFTLGKGRRGFILKMTGGGFSIDNLIDTERFLTHSYLVLEDNLLRDTQLPTFDVLVNTIADADMEMETLKVVDRFVRSHPELPLINHPEKVMETTRDNNYRRLNPLNGLVFARTDRLTPGDYSLSELDSYLTGKGFTLPVLVRESGTQTGISFDMAETVTDVQRRVRKKIDLDYYIIQYREELFKGKYFRKMRFFFIDGKMYPIVCHIDQQWNVHGSNRKEFMKGHEWMVDEEKCFLADPRGYLGEKIYDRIGGLYDIVGLDFFGVDFTVTEKGEVLIYELNAQMLHHYEHAENFPYQKPYLDNVTQAFNQMIRDKAVVAGSLA